MINPNRSPSGEGSDLFFCLCAVPDEGMEDRMLKKSLQKFFKKKIDI